LNEDVYPSGHHISSSFVFSKSATSSSTDHNDILKKMLLYCAVKRNKPELINAIPQEVKEKTISGDYPLYLA
jgi:hypothetical protein